jgi:hypothetical protein
MKRLKISLMATVFLVGPMAWAEACVTQSQMTAPVRDGLAAVARSLAEKVQAGDVAGLRTMAVPELMNNFGGAEGVVGQTAPKLKGGTLTVSQVYVLDGADLKRAADGSAPDAQFFCTLNKSVSEVDFLIPGLPPGKYGFAIVDSSSAVPWQLSFLLRQEQGKWLMAGLYPKAVVAAGHDGLWYWTTARQMVKDKEQWNAWLYYQLAESLLRPVGFLQSTHLEKLHTEQSAAAPPALSDGVTPDAPLVVKGPDGVEYHFTGLGVDDSLAKEKVDVIAHLKVDQIGDAATAHKRNSDAMSALVGAYPEMRKAFHGVWIFADVQGQTTYPSEQAMTEIH